MERKANGLDATEALRKGSWTAKERGAQVTRLLREAERQTRMDRVDPRGQLEEQMQLVEQNAEAQRSRKDRRKAGIQEGLLNRPMKGGLNLTDARKRRLVKPRSSPPRASRLTAELESRSLLVSRRMRKKGTVVTDLDRFKGSQEVFGMR